MLTNIDQGALRGHNMVNIHKQLTALRGWDKLSSDCKLNSSDYIIDSILLSEQQAVQIRNFGLKHQSFLASMEHKIRED